MTIAKCQLPNEMRKPSPRAKITCGNSQSPIGNRTSASSVESQSAFPSRPRLSFTFGNWQSAFGIRRAFTLVELMLSLAMVLLLTIGINYVFRSATDAVSAGQSLNAINNDAQATQPLLFGDLRNASKNPPCFIIASQLVNQFLNSDDAKTSSNPTVIPIDNAGGKVTIGNGLSANGFLSPAILNNRNHRADLLKFFAHDLYHRRSGNDGTYTGSETSDDAYIEIGHAALPANDLSNFYGPSNLPLTAGQISTLGLPGVPRIGAYASDWVLARRITLLLSAFQNTPGSPQPIIANDYYYGIDTSPTFPLTIAGSGFPFAINMSPLSYGTPDMLQTTGTPASQGTLAQSSRYDIAGVTPEQYDRIIANWILMWQTAGYNGTSLWWNPLVNSIPVTQTIPTPPQSLALSIAPYSLTYYNAVPKYVSGFPRATTYRPPGIILPDPGLQLNRPQCNPLIQSPVTAAALAEMAPYFLQHCSQFVVEYAGDYMQQDNLATDATFGNMTGLGPDGQIDYYVDANKNKHIRWYGMPRSSTGIPHLDGLGTTPADSVLIRGYQLAKDKQNPLPAAGLSVNSFTDVIPLRDFYSMWFNSVNNDNAIYSPTWEVDVNFDPTLDYGSYATAIPAPYTTGNVAFNDPKNPPRYVAAWHDDMPAMIRILIKVDDPNNKVKDGPWYEYVFRLK
jgi:type II secretory pathway pseudopilin PulG